MLVGHNIQSRSFWSYNWSRKGLYSALLVGLLLPMTRYTSYAQGTDSLLLYLEKAGAAREQGQWKEALKQYSMVLRREEVVPLETVYDIGEALYQTGALGKAERMFTAYVAKESDTTTVRSKQARGFLQKISAAYLAIIACTYCDDRGYRYVPHVTCGGQGKISTPCTTCHTHRYLLCQYCQGQGVIIEQDMLGDTYEKCTHCAGKGRLLCTTCDGLGYSSADCVSCHGTGLVPSPTEHCTHTGTENVQRLKVLD